VIAVCLLTCDRRAYTETTLRTFSEQNDASRFMLLHADDASEDPGVPALARAYGFSTVVTSTQREGWLPVRIRLFEQAQQRGADWVLFLENDQEWARPFPWALFDYIQERQQFYCLRLYGEFKARDRQEPSFVYSKLDRSKPVSWKRLKYAPEPAQACRIHWSAQPSVTRIEPLLKLHRNRLESDDLTARVKENVTYHIGVERTARVDTVEVTA
jgi:hypothetical protein